jgi:hypothetical protein
MQKGEKIVVKISDDFKQIIFSNGVEHYLLKGNNQDIYPWIKDKFLRNVVNHHEDFYLVTSKDYDRDIDILHSSNQKFNATLKRCIEPGIIDVFDSMIMKYQDDGSQKVLKTLMKVGDYLFMDTYSLEETKTPKKTF